MEENPDLDPRRADWEQLLRRLCEQVHVAVQVGQAKAKRKRLEDDEFSVGLIIPQFKEARVEVRKERSPHKEPHLHVTHSDEVSASLRLRDLTVIVGTIDRRTLREIQRRFMPQRPALMEIWDALSEGDSIRAHETIQSLT
jgi:hypothetical protein